MKHRKIFAVLLLNFAFLFTVQPINAITFYSNVSQTVFADKFYRTELYFGMNIPGGGTVSDEEWNDFLEKEVTPRFPEGFTVLAGFGQFRDNNGKIVKENSRVLIILYPKKARRENHAKIEQIRAAYVKTFRQESVLRMDFRQSVEVSF